MPTALKLKAWNCSLVIAGSAKPLLNNNNKNKTKESKTNKQTNEKPGHLMSHQGEITPAVITSVFGSLNQRGWNAFFGFCGSYRRVHWLLSCQSKAGALSSRKEKGKAQLELLPAFLPFLRAPVCPSWIPYASLMLTSRSRRGAWACQ